MPHHKPGTRVGAISHTEGDTIFIFGYGTYDGHFVPPAESGITFFGMPMEHENPRITLDSGKVVWGCECWWRPEEQLKVQCAAFAKVVEVDIEVARQESKRKSLEQA